WITLLEVKKLQDLLEKIKELQDNERLRLLLPEQLEVELARHRPRILKSRKASMQTYLKHARELLRELLPGSESEELLLKAEAKLPDWEASTDQVETLFNQIFSHKSAIRIKTNDEIRLRAFDRCLSRRAPAHRNCNSTADALLLES